VITILTGAPGHGKSYTAVKLIDESVSKGKMVVTNVPLREDWAYQMARYHTLFGSLRKNAVKKKQDRFTSLVHVVRPLEDGSGNLGEILRVRFSGKGEGRGRVILDESQRDINVRQGKAKDEKHVRLAVVNWVSAHRHYGVDVTLLTQAIGNIDLQIRNLYEFHAEVRNFRRLPFVGWICRLLPGGNLFLRTTVWNDRAKTKSGVVMYGLNKRLASLYSTHSMEEVDWPDDAIVLPHGSRGNVTTTTRTTEYEHATIPPWSNGLLVDIVESSSQKKARRKREVRRMSST
jgi:hypothetical protein